MENKNLINHSIFVLLYLLVYSTIISYRVVSGNTLGGCISIQDLLYENLSCFEYRNMSICEGKEKIPKDKLEVILSTIDSLHDNVTEKYSMKNNPVCLLYLSEHDFYTTFNVYQDAYALAGEWSDNSFLIAISTRSLDEVKERNNGFIQYYDYNMKNPNRFFDKNFLSRAIVHEYVHIMQIKYPEFLNTYALAVGWEQNGDSYKPPENPGEDFLKVNCEYALTNPLEDQAESLSDPFTCSSNSELLSPERQSFFMRFWNGPREVYCKEFNNK